MSYTKQTWATGDVITAEKLNHMEDGIASGAIVTIGGSYIENDFTLDKTWQEIYDILASGASCVVCYADSSLQTAGVYIVTMAFYDMIDNIYKVVVVDSIVNIYEAATSDGYPTGH